MLMQIEKIDYNIITVYKIAIIIEYNNILMKMCY